MKSRSTVLLGIAAIALVLAVTILMFRTHAAIESSALSDRDLNEIRLLNEAYRTAWLRNDQEGVIKTLAKDAVIIPSGLQPIAGLEAIGKFWWPNDGSKTTITDFTATIDEIGGEHGFAYILGKDVVTFTYEKDGSPSHSVSSAVNLSIVTRQSDGHWRISRRMWSTLGH